MQKKKQGQTGTTTAGDFVHAAVLGELSSIPAAAAVAANDRVPWGPLYGGGGRRVWPGIEVEGGGRAKGE